MRSVIIVILCALLAGCPLIYEATVRNDTDSEIEVIWASSKIASNRIESIDAIVLPWYVLCVTIKSDITSQHYQVPDTLPDGVKTSGVFSSRVTFSIVINNDGLNFESESGKLIPIKKMSECIRT